RNRSHWSTSKTPSYTKSVSWQHHQEEFVSYIFDKTVEMYAATYGSCNPLNKPEGKDDFDKIYRFLEDRYIKRLEDAGIKSPVKSPLS
ncbi:hypothetical protein PO413_22610, partial [Escherichia coli]